MDKPGFITPPPNLIPPRHDTGTQTERAPSRKRELPVFLPATPPAPAAQARTEQPSWRLTLPDGSTIVVTGALLLGRDPVHFEPWSNATLVKLEDPAKSVSKTHAVIETTGSGLSVTDLHSTNGVFVVPAGGAESGREIAVEPGGSADLSVGSSIELGRYTILVDQT